MNYLSLYEVFNTCIVYFDYFCLQKADQSCVPVLEGKIMLIQN
jgi:hypothetical protein